MEAGAAIQKTLACTTTERRRRIEPLLKLEFLIRNWMAVPDKCFPTVIC